MAYRRLTRSGLLAAALVASSPAVADPRGWDQASSIGRDLLVASALGIPAIQGDWTGSLQAGGSMVVAGGTTYELKRLFPETRPDQSNRQSFPSGHTSVSFAAAATLENRYGWKVGLPAFVIATFVGVARVKARKHNWYDVLAGAAIGTGSGFLLTTKRNSNVRLTPWGDSSGGGISLAAHFEKRSISEIERTETGILTSRKKGTVNANASSFPKLVNIFRYC